MDGEDSENNKGKIDIEKQEVLLETQLRIYVADEEGEKVNGSTFVIKNSQGEQIEELTIRDGYASIKGLEPGEYTIENTSWNENYLQAETRTFELERGAIRVVRIENLLNIPRGDIKLATLYQTEDGETKNLARSEYKIYSKQTGNLLTFLRQTDGSYVVSTLPNASNAITLKAGTVTVKNIEIGEYEIGLTDLTEGYSVTKEEVETVEVKQNEETLVETKVSKSGMKKVVVNNGYQITVGIDELGKVWTWGSGILGDGTSSSSNAVQCISSIKGNPLNNVKIVDITCNINTCVILALDSEGRVWSWGNNPYGQLGDGTSGSSVYSPQCISDIEGHPLKGVEIVKISAGAYGETTAIDSEGRVWVWGYQTEAISGNESCTTLIPIDITEKFNGSKIVDVQSGLAFNFALDSEGKIWAWGNNYSSFYETTGSETEKPFVTPVCISDIEGSALKEVEIVQISFRYQHIVALDSKGKVWTWGYNYYGQLGDGTTTSKSTPQCISDIEGNPLKNIKITNVQAGNCSTALIDNKGKLWSWGSYSGDGTSNNTSTPQCISDIGDNKINDNKFVQISLGIQTGSAIDENGSLYMWGSGVYLGENFTGNKTYYSPTLAQIDIKNKFQYLTFKEISLGNNHTVALDSEGKVWTAGYYACTGIGDNYYNYLNKLTCISEIIDNPLNGVEITQISAKNDYTVALDSEGKVWTWGYSNYGQLGDGTTTSKYTPQCISNIEGNPLNGVKIVDISAGNYYTVALDSEGKVWTWGNNNYGQLGDGTSAGKYVPQCINIDIDGQEIKKISAGYYNTVLLDSEGKVWVAGLAPYAGIGDDFYNILGSYYITEFMCLNNLENHPLNNRTITHISAGDSHTVALDSEGKVWTWGYNNYGQLGDETTTTKSLPQCISDIEGNPLNEVKIVDISGDNHTVAIDSEGKVWTWGNNSYGQLGDGTTDNQYVPQCMENYDFDVSKIIAGSGDTAVIDSEGKVWIWGYNCYYKLGIGSTDSMTTYPKNIQTIEARKNRIYNVKFTNLIQNGISIDEEGNTWKISKDIGGRITNTEVEERKNEVSGSNHTIKLDEEGKVWTKGSNTNYQLGVKYPVATNPDPILSSLKNIKITQISAGRNHTVAIDSEGKVWTWGYNSYGQLGDGTTISKYTLQCISNIEGNPLNGVKIVDISAGNYHTVAIDNEGKVWTWGNNNSGQLGNNSTNTSKVPIDISSKFTNEIVSISAGSDHTVAIDSEGKVWTWGLNNSGQLGDNSTNISKVPIDISSRFNNKIVSISAGYNHTVALDSEGKVWTWGNNSGQLGDGTTEIKYSPQCISNIEGNSLNGVEITSISAENYYTEALDSEGKVWTWGYNYYGRLGDGTTEIKYSPQCISNIEGNSLNGVEIISISAGYNHTVALDSEGKVWTWGYNNYGQLGDGTTASKYVPQCISNIEGNLLNEVRIVDISAGYYHTVALDSEGKVWTWGYNNNGQLGDGSLTRSDDYICLSEMEESNLYGIQIRQIDANTNYNAVVDLEGKVWIWGTNDNIIINGEKLNTYEAICINEIEGLMGIRFTAVSAMKDYVILLDTEGKIWIIDSEICCLTDREEIYVPGVLDRWILVR